MQIPHCYPDTINDAAPKLKTHVSIKSAIFYLIFVVNSLGFEKSRFKTFLKVQEAGTSSKLSDLLA